MRASALAILAFALLPVGASVAYAQEASHPEACDQGVRVTIEGTLGTQKEYGPPGWGEDTAHDQPWTMVTLTLTDRSRGIVAAFLKRCGEDEAEAAVVQMQVDQAAWKRIRAGKHAVVQGKLRLTDNRADEIHTGQVEVSTLTIQ